MKRNIVMVGVMTLILLNSCQYPPPPSVEVYSRIELSGLQYDKVKIEFSEFELHKNKIEYYGRAYIMVRKPEALTGALTINDVKITNYKTSVIDAIEAKKPVIIKGAIKGLSSIDFDFSFVPSESPLDKVSLSYRLKVDTEGLKANKNLFDKKIEFTTKYGYYTKKDINILNKKVDIKY